MDLRSGTIVVGLDESASSKRALAWAAEQALADRRELTLVHTINAVTPAYLDAAAEDPRNARAALLAHAEALFTAARKDLAHTAPDLVVHEVFSFADRASSCSSCRSAPLSWSWGRADVARFGACCSGRSELRWCATPRARGHPSPLEPGPGTQRDRRGR